MTEPNTPRQREGVDRQQGIDNPQQEAQRRVSDITRAPALTKMQEIKSTLQSCRLEPGQVDPKWDVENAVTADNKHYYFVSKDGGEFLGGIVIDGQSCTYVTVKPPPLFNLAVRVKIRDEGGQFHREKAMKLLEGQTSPPAAPAAEPVRPAPQQQENAPAAVPEQGNLSPSERAAEKVFGEIAGLRLEAPGQEVRLTLDTSVDTPKKLASRLRKLSIPIARYEQYTANMRDHARELSKMMSRPDIKKPFGPVLFDGQRFSVSNGQENFVSLPTNVLRMPASGSIARLDNRADLTSMNSGMRITVRELPNGTEVRSANGVREIYRKDGGLQLRETAGERHYFDGSNTTPVMIKGSGECDVVGPAGDRVGMKRPRTYAEAEAWANEIAPKLKTPEAIGAFVSQFFWGQDYHAGQPEHSQWFREIQSTDNPVRYQGEAPTVQDVQHYQRTLTLRSGDCEDYALLAQGLMKKIGIPSCVTLVKTNHFEAVYFEPAGKDETGREQYHVCQVGLYGFSRSQATFTSLGEAMRSTWSSPSSSTSGANFTLRDLSVRRAFESQRLIPKDASGRDAEGISYLEQNDPAARDGSVGLIAYSDEESFKQYVRRN